MSGSQNCSDVDETGEVTKTFKADNLEVLRTQSRDELGRTAAAAIGKRIYELLSRQQTIRMVFAAAPSQDEMLAALTANLTIDWRRISAFHMDEYIGLAKRSPQLFRNYLNAHLFSKVKFGSVHLIDSTPTNVPGECERYGGLIAEAPVDIVCMGIGENGHIAFNDPGVADFHDREIVKVARLDSLCRRQQVNDGCFTKLSAVPRFAFTLTIPTLLSGKYLFVSVPGIRKAGAVRATLNDEIDVECPATILRTHPNAVLFLDKDSSSMLD